jgi:hypothetical protein
MCLIRLAVESVTLNRGMVPKRLTLSGRGQVGPG